MFALDEEVLEMVRQSKKTLGYENIVLNFDDGIVIKMTVGDLRHIIIEAETKENKP